MIRRPSPFTVTHKFKTLSATMDLELHVIRSSFFPHLHVDSPKGNTLAFDFPPWNAWVPKIFELTLSHVALFSFLNFSVIFIAKFPYVKLSFH